ncbi:MAG: hypothetical protein PHX61_05655 [Alphaproteobacteria bacterium]|nr:hypothetical protein [Alphaproteobacteria bacterium]
MGLRAPQRAAAPAKNPDQGRLNIVAPAAQKSDLRAFLSFSTILLIELIGIMMNSLVSN